MKPVWRYSLFGLAAYLVFMLVLFPADRIYSLLQQRGVLPLPLYQVSGSLWRGHIGMVRVAGLDIKNIDWSLHPLALLRGRLELDLSLADADSTVGIVAGRKLDGHYYLRSNEALALPVLESMFNKRPFGLTGDVSLDLDDIGLVDGRLKQLGGTLRWQQAGLAAPLNINVGDFDLLLSTQDGVVQGTLSDDGGPLQAEGLIMLLPDNSYRLTMTLAARDKSRSDLKQALGLLGTPSPEGKISVARRGRLDLATLQH